MFITDSPLSMLRFLSKDRLPIVVQSEAAECGLACLAMIANYYGYRVDLRTLRKRFPITLKGATLSQIIQIAHQLNMSGRPLSLDLEHMRELRLPCILHWRFNHFVVLKSVRKKGIEIHDPAYGARRVSWSEANKSFTGVALELIPSPGFKQEEDMARLRLFRFLGNLDGFLRSVIVVIVLSLAIQLFGLLSPLYMQIVVDNVVVSGDENLLVVLAIGFGLVVCIGSLTSALRSLSIIVLSNQLNMQVASRLMHHLLRLPLSFFETRHIGDLVSRFHSLDYVRNQMTVGLVESVVDGVMAIAILVMMLVYSATLSVIVLVAAGLYLLVRFAWYRPIKYATEEQIVAASIKDSNFMETVRAIQSIKLHDRAAQRESAWQNHLADELNAGIKLGRMNTIWTAANQLIFGLENVIVIYFGSLSVLESALSIGMLYAFMSYKGQFTSRAAALIDRWIEFKMLRLHLERLGDIVLESEEDAVVGEMRCKPLKGRVELRGLSFRYSKGEPYLFKGINITIEAGESVAVIGKSGSGKSTLLKIMLGILRPLEGEVLYDGVSIEKLGLAGLRRQVGAVMQNDRLLAGSIGDNISFFDEKPNMEWVVECAKIAGIHDDIMLSPMGYDSLIGDMGSALSAGQEQRILLARALYKKPRIMILDEASAHLDVETEQLVYENIKKLGITLVYVAHRPEAVAYADYVFVIKNSGAVLQGP